MKAISEDARCRIVDGLILATLAGVAIWVFTGCGSTGWLGAGAGSGGAAAVAATADAIDAATPVISAGADALLIGSGALVTAGLGLLTHKMRAKKKAAKAASSTGEDA